MTQQVLLPWIHLAKQLFPSPQRLKVVFNRLPKPNEKCVAQIWLNDALVQDVTKLSHQPGFNQRQRSAITHLAPAQTYHMRPEGLTLSHEQVSSLLPFCQDIALEVQNLGTLSLSNTSAKLAGQLSNLDETIRLSFIASTHHGEAIEAPLLFGKDICFLVSNDLKIYNVFPALLPEELKTLLACPPLSLNALQDPEAIQTLYQLANLGVDLSCLSDLASSSINPTLVLRVLHNRLSSGETVLRLHIVTQFHSGEETEEVEVPAKGYSCPVFYWPHEPVGFLKRPHNQEEEARQLLFSLGAKPAERHRGFELFGPRAVDALQHIIERKALPSWLHLEQDDLPNIVQLPIMPTLVLSATASANELLAGINLGIGHTDSSLSIHSLLNAFANNQTAILTEDDKLITFSKDTLKAIATLSEILGIQEFDKPTKASFKEVGLLYSALKNHLQLQAQDKIQQRLDNFYPAPLPEDRLIPSTVETKLRPYQQDAIAWLSQLHRAQLGRILADDMGLGKTLMVLSFIAKLREEEGKMPSLVIAPTSVIDVWVAEAKRHIPSLVVHKWHGINRNELLEEAKQADIIVTSYTILRRDSKDILSQIPFHYLILDEAQNIKNSKTESWKSANLIQSKQRLALTGTPIENRVEDLFNIADLLEPGVLGSERNFQKRYGMPIGQGNLERAEELRLRVHPLILRRKKSDVESELPPKIESVLTCSMTPAQVALYKTVLQRVSTELHSAIYEEADSKQRISMLAALTRLRQVCCDPRLLAPHMHLEESAKAMLLKEVLEECLLEGRRLIVYSQFVKMHPYIHDVLKQLGVKNALWLHGASKNRAHIVEQFQDPNGPQVIVVSLKAGGTGITLTAADTVIFYDPWWNPAVEDQAADRAHRIGQTKTVHVIKLLCKNSIEEQIFSLSSQKRLAAQSVLTTDQQGPRQLTLEEIQRLLAIEIERNIDNDSSET